MRPESDPRPVPPLWRILASDYACTLCAIAPVVAWGLWLALDVLEMGRTGPTRDVFPGVSAMLLAVLAVSAVSLPLLARRLLGIRAVFARGAEVEGVVTAVGFHEDRGTVEVAFALDGQERRVSSAIAKNARTSVLRAGLPVVVVVDPRDPSRAFVRDLFLD